MTCYLGDCRDGMRQMIADGVRVQMCVTSPPYFGLRDYGTAAWEGGDAGCNHQAAKRACGNSPSAMSTLTTNNGRGPKPGDKFSQGSQFGYAQWCQTCGARRVDQQIGLEPTIAEYVANMVEVFRLVRELLADDGTIWINLGDSYSGSGKGGNLIDSYSVIGNTAREAAKTKFAGEPRTTDGLKPKDLMGIPWRVAFALQQPYYTGSIKDERDRIWLAAMLDAEGCMFIQKRLAGQHNGQGYFRQNDNYGPGVEICNTSLAIVERIMALVGKGSICSQGPEENARRKQRIYRWNLRTIESRDFVRELYPYLIAKQHQARLMIGCPSSGELAQAAHSALIGLHRGTATSVDFPAPRSMFEPGYYLRQDLIWNKPNCMPESVTDRCTKSHEYLFLLTKSKQYYFDAAAIAEPSTGQNGAAANFCRTTKDHVIPGQSVAQHRLDRTSTVDIGTRNKRSVWTVASQPFADAHFATFPPKLIEPCILAGTSERGHCPDCGKRWERVTERTAMVIDRSERIHELGHTRSSGTMVEPATCKTVGWTAGCACGSVPVQDIVFDPFMGSGTTGQVAQQLGRRWLGCELNSAYVTMQQQRTAQQGIAFA